MHIVGLVLRDAFLQVAIGLLIGIPLAIGAGKLMSAQLFEMHSWDPLVLGTAVVSLGLCGDRKHSAGATGSIDGSVEGTTNGVVEPSLLTLLSSIGGPA